MRVNHGRLHIFMTQQFLNRPDIIPAGKQVRGKAVPQGVTAAVFGNAGFTDRCFLRLSAARCHKDGAGAARRCAGLLRYDEREKRIAIQTSIPL